MLDDSTISVGPGDNRSLRECTLSHEPKNVLERLRALVTDDLGPDERAAIQREIRGWEYHVAALERQPI
jgi:hypothetical protein